MRCKAFSTILVAALASGLLVSAPAASAETRYNTTTTVADKVAPKLVSVKLGTQASITPTGQIVFNWSVDDQGTGVERVSFDIADAKDASAGSTTAITGTTAISGGFRTTGTTTVTPNRTNMKPGKIVVKSITLEDKAGNTSVVDGATQLNPLTVTVSNPDFDDASPVVSGTWSKKVYAPGERAVFNWKLTDAHVNQSVSNAPKLRLQDGVYLHNVVTRTTATTQEGYSYWDIPNDFEYGKPLRIAETSMWDKFSNWQGVKTGSYPEASINDTAHPLAAVKFNGTPGAGQTLKIDTSAWKGATIKVSWYAGVNSSMSTKTGTSFTFPTVAKGYKPNTRFSITVTGTWPDKTVRTRTFQGISQTYTAPAAAPGKITISGTQSVGNKLTANLSGWPAGYTTVGQWTFADGQPAAPLGATSISLTSAHAKKTLKFCVTATKAGATATGTCSTNEIATSDFTDINAQVHWDKGFKTRAVAGDTARLTFTEPKVPGISVKYQWRVGGVDVPGATGKTFKIPANAAGKYVNVYVITTAPGYNYKSTWPTGSTAVTPTVGDAVIVSGSNKVGSSLTAKAGYWTKGTKINYQWQRNGVTIKWGEKYTPVAADANKTLSVKTTAYRTGGETVERTVKVGKTALGSYPKASFTLKGYTKNSGSTLWATQNSGKVTGQKLSYQWYRNGKAIKGATKANYKTTKSDRQRRITVKITRSAPGYKGKSTTTSSGLNIKPGTLKKITVKASGTAKAGKTLTAKRGASTSGTKYAYQWYKNGKAIKGATKSTYKLAKGDKKASIQVRVKLSKDGFNNRTAWSSKVKIAK